MRFRLKYINPYRHLINSKAYKPISHSHAIAHNNKHNVPIVCAVNFCVLFSFFSADYRERMMPTIMHFIVQSVAREMQTNMKNRSNARIDQHLFAYKRQKLTTLELEARILPNRKKRKGWSINRRSATCGQSTEMTITGQNKICTNALRQRDILFDYSASLCF